MGEQVKKQIIRKDAKGCFVESLNDMFEVGKAHFVFVAYDANKPVGDRQTNNIHIYIDIAEVVDFCYMLDSRSFRHLVDDLKKRGDKAPVREWMGGTSAEKLEKKGQARTDGMCLSRVAKLVCGSKVDFMFVADSGAGELNEKGLIVPRFGSRPEQHVVVSLSWGDLRELFLMTKLHYEAWLCAEYVKASSSHTPQGKA